MRKFLEKLKKDITEDCEDVVIESIDGHDCYIFVNEPKSRACMIFYNDQQNTYECQKIDVLYNFWAKEEGFDPEQRVTKLQKEIFEPMQISLVKEYLK